jgi:hypothetical protein
VQFKGHILGVTNFHNSKLHLLVDLICLQQSMNRHENKMNDDRFITKANGSKAETYSQSSVSEK